MMNVSVQDEMRKVYTNTLLSLAEEDENIVVLDADLMVANGTKAFYQRFPQRAFDVGAAEANMVGIASGLSATGKIPFAGTFACFASRRVFDQFYLSANYAQLNVKLIGTDPGVTATSNGGTHMAFEDLALMRTIPEITIVEPADNVSLRSLLPQVAREKGCAYIRIDRKSSPVIYDESEGFQLGKAKVLRDGTDCTIIAAGIVLVPEAVKAAEILKSRGISAAVLDMHTISPLDEGAVLEYAEKTGFVLTCENHQVNGGLGSAVAEVLGEKRPTPMKRIGASGLFGQVGSLEYLKEAYGMTAEKIASACLEGLERKA
ncbi:MAG: transketolase family protein [Spirochaetales bacterium]|nr:transketolase family protein [Spirochaetales bacterium]MCF7937502.1 transketolase family protein [Spirochaetales bacterium]